MYRYGPVVTTRTPGRTWAVTFQSSPRVRITQERKPTDAATPAIAASSTARATRRDGRGHAHTANSAMCAATISGYVAGAAWYAGPVFLRLRAEIRSSAR